MFEMMGYGATLLLHLVHLIRRQPLDLGFGRHDFASGTTFRAVVEQIFVLVYDKIAWD
jgi:hypothetical protein